MLWHTDTMKRSRLIDTRARLIPPTRDEVVAWFRTCTVAELRYVIRAIEDLAWTPPRWVISNPAPYWDTTGNPPHPDFAARLVLADVGPERLKVLKALRAHTGWSLVETRDRLAALPVVLESQPREKTQALHACLRALGAVATFSPY